MSAPGTFVPPPPVNEPVKNYAPGSPEREELPRAQEDRGALVPGHPRPLVVRVSGGVDRLLHVLGPALRDVRQHMALAMRHDGLERLSRLDVLPADDERDLDPLGLHLGEALPELRALG